MTHKKVKNLLITLVIIVGLVAIIYTIKKPKPIAVEVVEVTTGTVESIVTNTRAGTVKACRQAELSPAIGGKIESLPIQKGSAVKQNDILLELWNDDLQARLSLAKTEAMAAQARAEEACTIAQVARTEASRVVKLFKQGLTSQETKERAEGEAKAKTASCNASKAVSEQSKAQIAVVEAMLEQTRLRAPFSGTVVEINGEVGEFTTPSPVGIPTLPAVILIDHQCMYVTAPIDEVDAQRIKTEMPARITLDAFDNQTFAGKVTRVGVYVLDVEKQSRTVDVDVSFSNPAQTSQLLHGYSADVEIITEQRHDKLYIPTEALLYNNRVFKYSGSDEKIYLVDVTPGLSNWQTTEILNGLSRGDKVVRNTDLDNLADGVPVIVENK
jgi:HlyD family secretion protein